MCVYIYGLYSRNKLQRDIYFTLIYSKHFPRNVVNSKKRIKRKCVPDFNKKRKPV
jgi:hypothetical protein